ncbi:MAG: DUF2797 domain-containing protein [Chlorobi bacterium]|nr:DUF2797 domain-containing protein [Chlorobiota bacterium]
MKIELSLSKMKTEKKNPVEYRLVYDDKEILMNDLTGKKIFFKWTGQINCIKCGNKTKKSFAQGYCYPCFISAPETAPCILRPELCEAHLGIARDLEWSKKNCLTTHYVYLALSSGLKVGVTRASQIPARWMDQGAAKAVKFAETPDRHIAGLIELNLKKYMSDKTSWQKMLKNDVNLDIDLNVEKEKAKKILKSDFLQYFTDDNEIYEFNYPVITYPEKIKSINLEKTPEFSGVLIGIKGQYLIFEDGKVINIRKYGGYKVIIGY